MKFESIRAKSIFAAVLSCALSCALIVPLLGRFSGNLPQSIEGGAAFEKFPLQTGNLELQPGDTLLGTPNLSADGHRALYQLQRAGMSQLKLWERGAGTSLILERSKPISELTFANSGRIALFFDVETAEAGARGLYQWEEGFGVQRLLPGFFTGDWRISLSANGARAMLAPVLPSSRYQPGEKRADIENNFLILDFLPRDNPDLFPNRPSKRNPLVRVTRGAVSESEAINQNSFSLPPLAPPKARLTKDDVDGDGAADLLTFLPLPDAPLWRAYMTNGFEGATLAVSGVTRLMLAFRAGDPSGIPVHGDYNGDGFLDFATYLGGAGEYYQGGKYNYSWKIILSAPRIVSQARVELNQLRSNSTPVSSVTDRPNAANLSSDEGAKQLLIDWTNFGDRAVPADYDGDGATDIASFSPAAGEWSIAYSAGGFNLTKAQRAMPGYGDKFKFGVVGDIAIVGDYDRDGKADPAIYRVRKGQKSIWSIRRSSKIALPAEKQLKQFAFGREGDVPLNGVFDCDGRTLPALYRPATGKWFIRRGQDNVEVIQWHVEGGVPLVADYDGDGCDDLAFFHPTSDIHWQIRNSRFQRSAAEIFPNQEPLLSRFFWGNEREIPAQLLLREHQAGLR